MIEGLSNSKEDIVVSALVPKKLCFTFRASMAMNAHSRCSKVYDLGVYARTSSVKNISYAFTCLWACLLSVHCRFSTSAYVSGTDNVNV